MIEEKRSQVLVDHVLLKVHVIARSRVEEHPVAFVKSAKANPVLFIHLLLLERDIVSLVVPGAEPLRRVRVDNSILVPHPQAKVLHRCESGLVTCILRCKLVVDFRQENRVRIEPIQVPPGTIVFGRCTKVLHPDELGHVAQEVIHERAVPLVALLVDTDSVVRRAECEKRVHFEISAAFDDRPRDKTSLRDAHDVDLFAGEVRIVVQFVANG